MNPAGKAFSIIGAAKSGLAAARSLCENGARVFISDIQSEEKLVTTLEKAGLTGKVSFEAGGHTEKVLEAEIIILSPGVRTDIPVLVKAQEKGIPVFSEIEIAYRMSKGRRLVITGSNGKTTTTTLLGEFCRRHFKEVFVGGNIGTPMMEFAGQTTENSIQVLEVSSFQLETIADFTPDIGVITNFFENHLDRYPSYKAYMDAKKRIALNMTGKQWMVLNADQSAMHELAGQLNCKIAWFGWETRGKYPALTVENEKFVYYDANQKRRELFSTDCPRIIGRHNSENIMCAALTALLAGVAPECLEPVVKSFPGVEHRLEWVRELDGVTWINDSKGTNCAASITALQACRQPLVLIAGGRDKGTDLSEWVETIRRRARGVILYGEAKMRFRSALEGLVPLKIAASFEEAVSIGQQWAEKGDTVLLSPACSSYDLFPNFEIRGERFKELVHQLSSNE
ncbi:MAG: UDP-N-acetylmuramoyl-L-alanine--D-glutamate ligase [Candidatus Rifleibacteriota bacterium]